MPSGNNGNTIPKFRPVLTGPQISHLIHLCKADGSSASLSCLSQLVLYEFKIQNSLVQEAYISPEKQTLSQSLGFEDSPSGESNQREGIHISSEALYNLWLTSPENLTVSQLSAVQKYRYENNKMTVDEERKYEEEVIGIS